MSDEHEKAIFDEFPAPWQPADLSVSNPESGFVRLPGKFDVVDGFGERVAHCSTPAIAELLAQQGQGARHMARVLRWVKFPVLTAGYVCLVDVMGDDAAIAQAARVSYGAGTKQVSDDETLIRYLMRHGHTTPFEMCEVKLLVKVPMDCWRQWIRHRTASVNEYSTRYSEAIDDRDCASEWRIQSTTNKQGSQAGSVEWPANYKVWPMADDGDLLTFEDMAEATHEHWAVVMLDAEGHPGEILEVFHGMQKAQVTPNLFLSRREMLTQEVANEIYHERLRFGVAREQARKDLPLSTYTKAYWKIDLHNLLNTFLYRRMDSHAQQEIREYAMVIGGIVKALFPITYEAFLDYKLERPVITRPEAMMTRRLVACADYRPPYSVATFMAAQPDEWKGKERCRERVECFQKLLDLGLVTLYEGESAPQ